MCFSKRQAVFNVLISQLNKISYQIESPGQRLEGMVWTKEAYIGYFWHQTPRLGTKLCFYELIFHAHIDEKHTDPFCFVKKK